MTFADKLTFLINLTSATNREMAEAMHVDPSMISRLRSSRRNAPKKLTYIKSMADFFAQKCEGKYQRAALSEVLERKQLQMQLGTEQLSAILYDWLTDTNDRVGHFLTTFDEFDADSQYAADDSAGAQPSAAGKPSVFVYYGNDGKRNAVASFTQYLLSSDKSGTIFLSTDESLEWLHENDSYLKYIQSQMEKLLARGFHICRIAEPLQSADQAFDSLSNWLPLYMTGQVESYYYPRMHDELYRRTIISLAGEAAVVSSSTAGQTVSGATVFTQNKKLADAYADEFRGVLSKCRPMMTVYSNDFNPDELLSCVTKFGNDRGDSIQQSTTLSSLTVPEEVAEYAVSGSSRNDAARILRALSMFRNSFRLCLSECEMIDIHSIATAAEVRGGNVPIGVGYLCGGAPVCYTPHTYALHLQSILKHMEEHSNYRAVLIPRSEDTHALFVKDKRQALLLRPGSSLTVFEVEQSNIALACDEYLRRRVESRLASAMQRQETISQLKTILRELGEA